MERSKRKPTKPPKPGERVPLGLRVTAEIKQDLDSASELNGRSQSQEAEFRLAQSFRDEQLLDQVQDRVYGRALAGVLMLLGEAMRDTAIFASKKNPTVSDDWISDPFVFDQVVRAANLALETIRPRGPPTTPGIEDLHQAELANNAAVYGTEGLLRALRGEAHSLRSLNRWAKAVRDRLGSAFSSKKETRR